MAGWLKIILEIGILWFLIYQIILFFAGTRAIQVVRGIIVLLALFFIVQRLDLQRLEWMLTKLFAISVVGLLIIFQPEIRQGLARLGRQHLLLFPLREEELDYLLKEIAKAVEQLNKQGIGALIAIERNSSLKPYTQTGVTIDAVATSELLQNIFTPASLLHDGGVIIQHGRINSAGCLFPLDESPDVSRIFGMRHRAAIGLSNETDAVVIVVSEERQSISLAYEGSLQQNLGREELTLKIKQLLAPKRGKG